MPQPDIHKAGGILIRDRKLLVERSQGKSAFIAPGGSVEPGESVEAALVRELKEEFNIDVTPDHFQTFGTFFAEAAGNIGKTVQMDVHIVTNWDGEPTPSSEVEEIAWITSEIPADMEVGSIFAHDVIPALKAQNLID